MLNLVRNQSKFLNVVISSFILCGLSNCASNKEKGIVERIEQLDKDNQLIFQIAELEIDSTQLESYLALLKEEIQTSVKEEPGVLTLYAMAEKDIPTKIKVLEIYSSREAYNSHIASPHFKKYKNGTIKMVNALTLMQAKPIVFAAKEK